MSGSSGVDRLSVLVPDPQCPEGGIETVNCALLPGLVERGCRVTWMTPAHRWPGLSARMAGRRAPDWIAAEWGKGHFERWVSATARRCGAAGLMRRMVARRIAFAERRARADWVLFPWVLGESVPKTKAKVAALLLDRNWARFPENFPRVSAAELDAGILAWMERADAVFTLSEFARGELVAFAPEHAAKIRAVTLAGEPGMPPIGAASREAIGKRGETVFYYPATVGAHKGHRVLLEAIALLAGEGAAFRVVLTGGGTDALGASRVAGDAAAFFREHAALWKGRLDALGTVSRDRVAELFDGCDAVVLPSLYEGFGLPLAEALRWGTPVLASDIPPYREQVGRFRAGDAVTFFPAGDAAALAGAMRARIGMPRPDPEARRVLSAAVGSAWDWTGVANEYLAVFQGGRP